MKQYRLSTLAKLSVATVALLTASTSLLAQGVIKIGEINSYKAQPAFLNPSFCNLFIFLLFLDGSLP